MLTEEEEQHAFNVLFEWEVKIRQLNHRRRYYFRIQGVIVAYKSKKPGLYTFLPLQEQGLYRILVNGKLSQ